MLCKVFFWIAICFLVVGDVFWFLYDEKTNTWQKLVMTGVCILILDLLWIAIRS